MEIHESAENYLEAILALTEKGSVRSIDVAQHLGFSKPSVSRAMSLLRDNGYVVMDENSFLVLTPAGWEYGGPIHIGNDVWLGGSCVVLAGVTIGDGAVVAAGSVVTRDVPPNTVVAGNPARVLRQITQADRDNWKKAMEQ